MARFSTHVFEGQIITFAWPHCYPIIVDRYGAGWRQMKRVPRPYRHFTFLSAGTATAWSPLTTSCKKESTKWLYIVLLQSSTKLVMLTEREEVVDKTLFPSFES